MGLASLDKEVVGASDDDMESVTSLVVQPKSFDAESVGDDYLTRLIKYIPAEMVTLFLTASNTVPRNWNWQREVSAQWFITAVVFLLTPLYFIKVTRSAGAPLLWQQVLFSTIAFPVWVFAIGGPFRLYQWYSEWQWSAGVLIAFTTVIMGIYKPKIGT
jgi:hypothetical protein